MRKNLFALACAVSLGTSPGLAADALTPDIPFTWSGAYVGVTGGITITQADVGLGAVNGDLLTLDVNNGLFLDTVDEADGDFAGGVRAGLDVQAGMLTFGVRAGFEKLGNGSASSHSALDPNCSTPLFCGLDTQSRYTTDVEAMASAEALVGVALGRNRAYVTGGVATAKIANTFDLALVPTQPGNLAYANSFAEEDWLYGYTVGAGVERALGDSFSVSLDYRYYDFEDVTVRAIDPPNFGDNFMDYDFSNRGHIATIGLHARF